MSETYGIPEAVAEAVRDGMPALKAFRQSSGLASHDVAVAAGIDPNRLAILENGELTASDAEINALAEVLAVPGDLLIESDDHSGSGMKRADPLRRRTSRTPRGAPDRLSPAPNYSGPTTPR